MLSISWLQLFLALEWGAVAFVGTSLIFGRDELTDKFANYLLVFMVGVAVGAGVI